MHYANMVRNVVVELQEALQQEQVHMETLTVKQTPVDHADNAVQNTHQRFDTQPQ